MKAAALSLRGPARLGAADLQEAIFGSFDGMTSTLGVVAGLLATNASASKIVAASIGIAVAATVGMGAGQYLSDGAKNLRIVIVMAVATLIGSVIPAVPFLFGDSRACIAASIAVTALAAALSVTTVAISCVRGLDRCVLLVASPYCRQHRRTPRPDRRRVGLRTSHCKQPKPSRGVQLGKAR